MASVVRAVSYPNELEKKAEECKFGHGDWSKAMQIGMAQVIMEKVDGENSISRCNKLEKANSVLQKVLHDNQKRHETDRQKYLFIIKDAKRKLNEVGLNVSMEF